MDGELSFDLTPKPARVIDPDSLEGRFWAFHNDNPDVYSTLRRLSLELVAAGRSRFGIKMLFEVVRWHTMLTTSDPVYKINNNHAPYYARLLMAREPRLDGVFALRALTSGGWDVDDDV